MLSVYKVKCRYADCRGTRRKPRACAINHYGLVNYGEWTNSVVSCLIAIVSQSLPLAIDTHYLTEESVQCKYVMFYSTGMRAEFSTLVYCVCVCLYNNKTT